MAFIARLTEAERLIWRYKYGHCSMEHLEEKFSDAIRDIHTKVVKLRPEISSLRDYLSTYEKTCDQSINAALISMEGKQYGEALRQLKRVDAALTRIREVLEVYEEYGSVKEDVQSLGELLDSDLLRRTVTLKTLISLLSEADFLLREGESRKALFITSLCRNKLKALRYEDEPDPDRAGLIRHRIAQAAQLYSRAADFCALPGEQVEFDKVFERLLCFLDNNLLTLTERLIDDIDFELRPRKTFLSAWCQKRRPVEYREEYSPGFTNELKQLILNDSWGAATARLLAGGLESLSANLASLKSDVLGGERKLHSACSLEIS